uniref:Tumor protein p53-inducible protein 11 n=1 Tax=Capra hircus TaxID=9925 RepID=A0A8C2RB73_CAPHI
MAAKQPPPLMKKHSQTDLVSRLKTRKILGVGGEDDDGEVHRSKISQVLGNEIKFAVREPLGLRVWQFVSAVLFSGIAIMALAFPDQLYDAVFDGAQVTSKTPIRLYGGALLSISLIMWNALYTAEKVIIRWTLLTEACYFSVQFLVVTATLAETGLVSEGILLLLASRLLFVAISVYYYYQVGRKPKKRAALWPSVLGLPWRAGCVCDWVTFKAQQGKKKQFSRPPPLTPISPSAPEGLSPLQAQHRCAHRPPRVPHLTPSFAPSHGDWWPRVLGTRVQGSRLGPRLASCLSTVLKGQSGWS